MLRVYIISFIIGILTTGCASSIPCYPPSYYDPEPGSSYTSEEVFVSSSDDTELVGTLTLPSDADPPFPAVILVTGSSPQNRDMMGSRFEPLCFYRPFRQIADSLSRQGIAVLRMDDRGVGCSGGGPLKDVTIPERAEDTRAGLNYLRGREEIDAQRLGIIGISEGGNIGPMLATTDPSIHALVIMSGSATNGWEIIEYQYRYEIDREQGLTDEDREQKVAEAMKNFELAVSRGEGSRWLESFLDYNPLQTAQKVSSPVLILHGDRDAHVPVEHAHLLAEAMRSGGNNDVTVKILADHNHPFLKDPDGRKSRYKELLRHTNKLSESLLKIISDWISNRLAQE